jgi:hypothetical protein
VQLTYHTKLKNGVHRQLIITEPSNKQYEIEEKLLEIGGFEGEEKSHGEAGLGILGRGHHSHPAAVLL